MNASTRTLLAAVGLVVLTNAVVLGGVAYNRAGPPQAVMTLTERELPIGGSYGSGQEDSSLHLRLQWRTEDTAGTALTKPKLEALGFDLSGTLADPKVRRHIDRLKPQPAFLVFEYDGPAHARELARAQAGVDQAAALAARNPDRKEFAVRLESAERSLDYVLHSASRLFVVDAGPEYAPLRRRYADTRHYLVLPGRVGVTYRLGDDRTWQVVGTVLGPLVTEINVPLPYRQVLDRRPMRVVRAASLETARKLADARPQGYEIELAVGRRLEPWVRAVTLSPGS